ncbi:MAG: tetratricopeptide repeat protein, partial [Armatimonadetes bacterium]|nr:tetratricopeptide repeat protein [Armatimonadota bacterium]
FLLAGLFAAGLFLGVYSHLPKSQQRRITTVLHLKDPYGKERSMIRQVGVDLFRQHPVFGTGYGTYRIYALERLAPGWYEDLGKSTRTMLVPNYAHNEYVQVLAGTGVIGGAIFIAMLGLAYWVGLRAALRHLSPDWARLGIAVLAGITAFLVQNFFGVTFRQPGTVTFFWLSLGLLTVAGAGVGAADAEQAAHPRVRQWHFRKLSVGAVTSVAVVLACLVLFLGSVLLGQVRAGVLVKRADSAAKRGRFDTAGMLAEQAIKADPYSVLAYYVGAYAWGSLGDHEKSLEANKKALSLLPGNASVYYNIGVNYKELGRFEEARESFERAIELMPTADRHYAAMAELLIVEGKMAEALSYAREAIGLSPKDSRFYMLAADITTRQRKLDETLEFIRQAAAVAPKDAKVWRQYAQLLVRRKQYDEAIRACNKWITIEPNSALAHNLLGTSYYDTRKFAAARAAFLKALEIDPAYGEARLNLAYTYAQLKDPDAMYSELIYLAETEPDTRAGRLARQMLGRGGRGPAR